jgi:hypothetical protein
MSSRRYPEERTPPQYLQAEQRAGEETEKAKGRHEQYIHAGPNGEVEGPHRSA